MTEIILSFFSSQREMWHFAPHPLHQSSQLDMIDYHSSGLILSFVAAVESMSLLMIWFIIIYLFSYNCGLDSIIIIILSSFF